MENISLENEVTGILFFHNILSTVLKGLYRTIKMISWWKHDILFRPYVNKQLRHFS